MITKDCTQYLVAELGSLGLTHGISGVTVLERVGFLISEPAVLRCGAAVMLCCRCYNTLVLEMLSMLYDRYSIL